MGRYQLLTPLASGGMAEIWLARQPGVRGFEKLVVIKRMVGALEDDPDHVEMFLSEARLAAQFSHPHIVQIFELGEAKGSFFIVMEYLDGESLSAVYRQSKKDHKPIPDHLAVKLAAWAAGALHYAHSRVDENGQPQCIVHRDVSPQNLVVTFDGSLKVVDFGIAKIASHATASGKLKGKLAYMAPEQARTQPVDARTDVFALGVVLFELITHGRLFPRADELEILSRLTVAEHLPRASERRPDVPASLDVLIAKAMAAEPEQRYQTAADFQTALEDWLVSTGHRATNADVAAYLKDLFAERIASRKALIDAAKRGDLASSAASAQVLAAVPGSGSGSSSLSGAPTAQSPKAIEVDVPRDPTVAAVRATLAPRRSKVPLAIGAVAVLAVAAGVFAATRPGPEATPPPTPVEPVVKTPPPPSTSTLAIDATPPEAKVRLDGIDPGAGPYTLPPGEHALEVSADGFVTDTRKVTVAAGERVSVIVKLEHAPTPVAVKHPDRAPHSAKGTLKLDTVPWTSVYLGGRKLGDTPILNAKLPAGRHVLRLVNPEAGVEQTIEVEIAANEETVKRLKLR